MNLTWWHYVKLNLKFITKEKFTKLKQKKVVFLFVRKLILISIAVTINTEDTKDEATKGQIEPPKTTSTWITSSSFKGLKRTDLMSQ